MRPAGSSDSTDSVCSNCLRSVIGLQYPLRRMNQRRWTQSSGFGDFTVHSTAQTGEYIYCVFEQRFAVWASCAFLHCTRRGVQNAFLFSRDQTGDSSLVRSNCRKGSWKVIATWLVIISSMDTLVDPLVSGFVAWCCGTEWNISPL